MLQLLDASLAALLKREVTVSDLTISFAAPDGEFQASPPALSLFLYDIRENVELRGEPWRTDPPPESADGPRHATVRRRAPARMDCSYLVTAWPGAIDDAVGEEHRLLGAAMRGLLRNRRMPADLPAAGVGSPDVPVLIALRPGGQLQSAGEFWQAMGGRPKAALHCVATVGVDLTDPVQVAPYVVTNDPHVTVTDGLPSVRT